MKKTEEDIREAALSEYADSIYPFNDKVDAFMSGAKWMQEQGDLEEELIEEEPILIGHLNRDYGYNAYHPIKKGTPVFSFKDHYFFEMELISSGQIHKQKFYKESLEHHIDKL